MKIQITNYKIQNTKNDRIQNKNMPQADTKPYQIVQFADTSYVRQSTKQPMCDKLQATAHGLQSRQKHLFVKK